MVAPIDYTSQVATPFEAGLQGLSFGAGIADMQAARQQQQIEAQQQQAKIEQQKRQDSILAELINNPNPTADDYSRATLAVPHMKDQIKQSWDLHSEGEKKASISEIGSVYSALSTGNPEIAIDILNRRASGLENSSGDPKQIEAAKTMAKMIELDLNFARTQSGFMLASIPGGKEIIEGADKLSAMRMKEGLHPGEIKKAAADLNKTEAETKKILAEVDKLGAEAQKAVLELEKGDPAERFNQEEKLRKEYTKRASGFIESQRIFDNLSASADIKSGPGDIALITSFMKMLDPGSVVRETEFATAQDTAGLLANLSNMATKVQSGQFLSDSQRKSFVALAGKYMSAADKEEKGVRTDLEKVIKNYGLDSENVFGTRAQSAEPAATPAARVITVDY